MDSHVGLKPRLDRRKCWQPTARPSVVHHDHVTATMPPCSVGIRCHSHALLKKCPRKSSIARHTNYKRVMGTIAVMTHQARRRQATGLRPNPPTVQTTCHDFMRLKSAAVCLGLALLSKT